MKYIDYMKLHPEEKLNYFISTLSITNRTPEYYVNWAKVERETRIFEIELNTLNYLIGKENIYEEALFLFSKQPDLLRAIPSLIACRDKLIDILFIDEDENITFERLDFNKIDNNKIRDYVDFIQQSGLLDFLKNKAKKSLVDYVYGVEAGLDSNARKNRSGTTMEGLIENQVSKICEDLNLEFKTQVTARYIFEKWNISVPVDKSERRFDVAVYSKKLNKLWVIETNYYGGGGSKLKAVAGEFTELNKFISTSNDKVEFVWITDGQGWKTAKLPLSEAFGYIPNIFNLEMINKDYLTILFIGE